MHQAGAVAYFHPDHLLNACFQSQDAAVSYLPAYDVYALNGIAYVFLHSKRANLGPLWEDTQYIHGGQQGSSDGGLQPADTHL